ncbi:hypothetical protein LguiA_028939 [Lonicera macranthoides]
MKIPKPCTGKMKLVTPPVVVVAHKGEPTLCILPSDKTMCSRLDKFPWQRSRSRIATTFQMVSFPGSNWSTNGHYPARDSCGVQNEVFIYPLGLGSLGSKETRDDSFNDSDLVTTYGLLGILLWLDWGSTVDMMTHGLLETLLQVDAAKEVDAAGEGFGFACIKGFGMVPVERAWNLHVERAWDLPVKRALVRTCRKGFEGLLFYRASADGLSSHRAFGEGLSSHRASEEGWLGDYGFEGVGHVQDSAMWLQDLAMVGVKMGLGGYLVIFHDGYKLGQNGTRRWIRCTRGFTMITLSIVEAGLIDRWLAQAHPSPQYDNPWNSAPVPFGQTPIVPFSQIPPYMSNPWTVQEPTPPPIVNTDIWPIGESSNPNVQPLSSVAPPLALPPDPIIGASSRSMDMFPIYVHESQPSNHISSFLKTLTKSRENPVVLPHANPTSDDLFNSFEEKRASVLPRERIVSLPKKVGTLDDMPVRVPVRSGRYLYGETQGRMICVCHGRVWRGEFRTVWAETNNFYCSSLFCDVDVILVIDFFCAGSTDTEDFASIDSDVEFAEEAPDSEGSLNNSTLLACKDLRRLEETVVHGSRKNSKKVRSDDSKADLDWYGEDGVDRGRAVVYRDVTRAALVPDVPWLLMEPVSHEIHRRSLLHMFA